MAPINFYWARGTGERFGMPTMYANVTRLLDRNIFDVREVPCIAEIRPMGGMHTITESMNSGYAWMDKNKQPGKPWMGGGYSLGALWMGNYVGTKKLSLCKGIAQLADPGRHRSQIYGPRKPAGWGISGERLIGYRDGYPVWSMSEPNDPISECPGDNGLRAITPFVGGLPQQPVPARINDVPYTLLWASYYTGNRHTNYANERPIIGSQRTYTQILADEVNKEGRRLVKAGLV